MNGCGTVIDLKMLRRRIQTARFRTWAIVSLTLQVLLALTMEQRYDLWVYRLRATLFLHYGVNPLLPSQSSPFNFLYPPIWLAWEIIAVYSWLLFTPIAFPNNPSSLWGGWSVPQPASFYLSGSYFQSYRYFIPPNLPLLDLLLKLPLILSVLAIGLIFLRKGIRLWTVVFLWLLNPYVLNFASGWGEFDVLAVLGTVVALYFAETRPSISAAALVFGVAVKLYPILFVAPMLLYMYRRGGLQLFTKYALTLAGVSSLILSTYLVPANGFQALISLLSNRAAPEFYGENFYHGITWQWLLTITGPSYNVVIFLPLILIPYVYIIYRLGKASEPNRETVTKTLTAILLTTYLTLSVVNPQYFMWVLPFLIILAAQGTIRERFVWLFSLLPLVTMYLAGNPLYYVSPALIPQEFDYPAYFWPAEVGILTLAGFIILFVSLKLIPTLLGSRTADQPESAL